MSQLSQQIRLLCSSKFDIYGIEIYIAKTFSSKAIFFTFIYTIYSVTSKKSPNVYKSCPKMISLVKLKIFTALQKLPKNARDLGKLVDPKGFEKLSTVQ